MRWHEARLGGHVLPGWVPILEKLNDGLLALDPDLEINQVKEKFGALRFYYFATQNAEEIKALVREAEIASEKICEVCGVDAPEGPALHGTSWLKTLCPEHAERRERTGEPAWKMVDEP